MDISTASQIAQSPAVWALCCILLTGFILKKLYEKNDEREDKLLKYHEEYREESKVRESQLMEHLERSNESQEATARALEGINGSLSALEGRVDRIEKHTYQKESA